MNISTDEQKAAVSAKALTIHKYSNRRYYDVTCSRHLTLEQIHKLILEGYDVRVLESKTGEDVTIELLAHIMLEHDRSKLKVFTVELMHQMMRANDSIMGAFVDEYFNKAFLAFMESQKAVKNYFNEDESAQRRHILTPLEMGAKWADAIMQPFKSAFMPRQASDLSHKAAPRDASPKTGACRVSGRRGAGGQKRRSSGSAGRRPAQRKNTR